MCPLPLSGPPEPANNSRNLPLVAPARWLDLVLVGLRLGVALGGSVGGTGHDEVDELESVDVLELAGLADCDGCNNCS